MITDLQIFKVGNFAPKKYANFKMLHKMYY